MVFGLRRSKAAPSSATETAPAPAQEQRIKRRTSVRDLWNTGVAKLPLRIKRPGKRKTRVITPGSKRASQVLSLPANVDDEKLFQRYDSTDSVHEISRPSGEQSQARISEVVTPSVRDFPATPGHLQTNFPTKFLSTHELSALFSGAPEYCVPDSQIGHTPKVAFYGSDLTRYEGAGDHTKFPHSTFSAATLKLHKEAENEDSLEPSPPTRPGSKSQSRDPLEVPNMTSFPGLEPGTVGFQYFLQLPISDSKLVDEQPDNEPKRRILYSNPSSLSLRPLSLERLIDRLTELGDLEQQRKKPDSVPATINEQKASEMYAELFGKFLTPPKYGSSAEADPTGLNVQIEALITVLTQQGLWHDFSLVEWRIRVGQLLWTTDDEMLSEEQDLVSERDTVLLQITLASELLVRLNAIDPAASNDAAQVGALLTPKTVWDLVLAGRFLDNVRIAPRVASTNKEQNRTSLFSMLSFVTAHESLEDTATQVVPVLYPRHERRQLEGLQTFSEGIDWPHTAEIKDRMSERVKQISAQAPTAFATPVGTPGVTTSKRDSYFGEAVRPRLGRVLTAQSIQLLPVTAYDTDAFDAGGWLSRSWLTGLVMPGEPISHFLISTLLENSPQAIESLGDSANLYGGFCYQGRSYWSKSSVVGRVVAATKGAKDCMGWISAPGLDTEQADGWVNVDFTEVHNSAERITNSGMIARDSSPFPSANSSEVKEADFTWPVDSDSTILTDIQYRGLRFHSTETSYELSKPGNVNGHSNSSSANGISAAAVLTATTSFSTPSKLEPITLPLTFDVYFITSYPCHPSSHRSPTVSAPGTPLEQKQLPQPPCHPLHKSYDYEIAPLSALLSSSELDPFGLGPREALSASGDGQEGGVGVKAKVVVLDARGSADAQVLARAWCARTGEHAVVGRGERTCLACCVREASGLGVRVVIRI